MITVQNADAALKDYYLDAVTAQLNEGISPFYAAIEKNADNVTGKDVSISVIKGFAGNMCAGAEDGDLPDPYKNRYANIVMPLKNLYGTIEISDKALRASRDASGAFINLLNAEMEGLVASAKQNFKRMLFSDGTGKIGTVTAKISSREYSVSGLKDYFAGLNVDCYSNLGAAIAGASNIFIERVNLAKGTVTFNKAITDTIVNATIYIHGSKDNELTGLSAIFDGNTLYGFDPEEEDYFRPYKVDCKNTLTEQTLGDMLDALEEHHNSKIDIILCSYATRRKIASLIDANRRIVNTIDARTGYGAVTVNDVPVYADKFCPDDRIYFLNSADFTLAQLCDWEWLEDEDGKILKQVNGKAAYSATLVKYAELICKRPCGQGMLYNFNAAASTGE
ncbi:MAG: phage major capsid protein [Clostridia bacterium]|nr:phage major capsid protein [Clostridia bacterium]